MTLSPDELTRLLGDATTDLGGPAPDFAPVLARGQQRRRNRRLATASGVVAAVVLVTGGVVAVTRPDTASRRQGPATTVAAVPSFAFAAVRDLSSDPQYGEAKALVLFGPGGHQERVLLPAVSGTRYESPTISPDGHWVYFVRAKDGAARVESSVERIPAVGGDPEVVIAPTIDGGEFRNPVISPDGGRIAVAQDGDIITTGVDAAGQGYSRWPRIGVQDVLVGYAPDGHALYALATLSPDEHGDRPAILRRIDLAKSTATDVQTFTFPLGNDACGGSGISAAVNAERYTVVVYGGCGTPLTVRVVDPQGAIDGRYSGTLGATTSDEWRPAEATSTREGVAFTLTRQGRCARGGPELVIHKLGDGNGLLNGDALRC